jgi:pimeloyl-ACP methyl ester carboxylesterase
MVEFLAIALALAPGLVLENDSVGFGKDEVSVDLLVTEYFQSSDAAVQAGLARRIEEAAGNDWRAVADAVQSVQLWAMVPRDGTITVPSTTPEGLRVFFQVPHHYDPSKRYPCLICLPHPDMPPAGLFGLLEQLLGSAISGFVLVVPPAAGQATFHRAPDEPLDVVALVKTVRRRIHVNTDRTFLFGTGYGGDAAWMAALAHPDLFAGVITVAGYPRLPYPDQVYPFYLANLRHLAVLSAWHNPGELPPDTRVQAVHRHNAALLDLARRQSLPICGADLTDARDLLMGLPAEALEPILAHTRATGPVHVSHWFRYPRQGRAGWLRQTAFRGDVWEAAQLSISASPGVDFDTFVRETIQAKLAQLAGRIEGQDIHIEARRCDRIEVLLGPEFVDFAQPVNVFCNGRRRHHKKITPSIRTLLSTAHDDWDFQRLVVARLSFSVKSDPQDAPSSSK